MKPQTGVGVSPKENAQAKRSANAERFCFMKGDSHGSLAEMRTGI